jgi:lysophospholipase L1-like esterase
MNRKFVCAAAVLAILCACAVSPALAGNDDDDRRGPRWVATWTAAPMPGDSTFGPDSPRLANQTVRHIVHLSVGGRRVRVKLSNLFGELPLVIGSARVALQDSGAAIVPDSDRPLTFRGSLSVTIPVGGEIFSDPVEVDLPTSATLAVSLYIAEDTGLPTYHAASRESSYISEPGDFTDAIELPVAAGGATTMQFGLSAVEVLPRESRDGRDDTGVIVAFGDSTTVGANATLDQRKTWPDQLFARLIPPHGRPRLAVVNGGIGCNRLIWFECGPSGLQRFEHDVLDIAGVSHVIVSLGLVDLGLPTVFGDRPEQIVSARQIIDGLRQLIARAHRRGLPIYGATITPSSSGFPGFWTPENEEKRQIVNRWIRTSRAFDGVIDFDQAVRDPDNLTQLKPIYSSDGIHMSDAGYLAMANAINLWLFY